MEFAAASLGAAPIDPLDAQLLAVHLSNGMVQFWRSRLAAERKPSQTTVDGYRAAIADLSRFAKNATDSHVAERQSAITGRLAEAIALVCEDGLNVLVGVGVLVSNDARVAYAQAIASGLGVLEGEPDGGVIEGTGRSLPV
jgi:hypothetical protein